MAKRTKPPEALAAISPEITAEQAQAAVIADREKRAQAFLQAYSILVKEHRCELIPVVMLIGREQQADFRVNVL